MCFHKNLATQQHLHLHFVGKGRCTKWFHDVHKLKIEHHSQKWHHLEKFQYFKRVDQGYDPTSCEFGSIHGKYTLQVQGTNISHLRKRNIIDSKVKWYPGYVLVPTRVKDQTRSAIFICTEFCFMYCLDFCFVSHQKIEPILTSFKILCCLESESNLLHFAARTFNWRWSRHLNPSSTRFAANCWGGRNGTL